jgi:hypothetical protein
MKSKPIRFALAVLCLILSISTMCYADPASVKTDKASYEPGETIKVTFSGASGLEGDWICIVPEGSPEKEGGDYQYVPTGRSSGILTFDAPAPLGRYEVRAYFNYSKVGYVVSSRTPFSISGSSGKSTSSRRTQFGFATEPFTEVVTVEGVKSDELYFRAREWFTMAFKSSKDVLQMDSKERGTLIGKGTIEIPPGSLIGPSKDAAGFVHFTLTVYVKDGRYKYEVADARHETEFKRIISAGSLYKSQADGGSVWWGALTNGAFEYVKDYSAKKLGTMLDSLKADMANNGATGAKRNDW